MNLRNKCNNCGTICDELHEGLCSDCVRRFKWKRYGYEAVILGKRKETARQLELPF